MSEEHEDILDILVNEAVSATELIDKSGESESEESPKPSKREREDDEDEEPEAKRICTEAEAENTEVDLSQYTPKEQERIKMQVLVSNFSEEQLNRYEVFRRATFPKASIKRLMSTVTTASIPSNVVIAMSGIAKVLVGDIVEGALDVMEMWNETGPIQPKHLREAYRKIRARSDYPSTRVKKFPLFS